MDKLFVSDAEALGQHIIRKGSIVTLFYFTDLIGGAPLNDCVETICISDESPICESIDGQKVGDVVELKNSDDIIVYVKIESVDNSVTS